LDDGRIVYVGSAGPEGRDELLGGAYALLHPIRFNEPFGLSVVESMACGTPVVAFNRGSMPEIIADGVTGYLVGHTDEMVRAVARVKELDRRTCRRRVEERFSVERMVDDYVRVYEKIIRQTRREDHRPWGYYEILSDRPDHKVKRITVYPGRRLSLQRHFRRSEHWSVVSGTAVATRNDEDVALAAGQSIDLPVGTWHRVRNRAADDLVFIEVQTGDYFGEDDIERAQDDYGRAK
jgi:mannose-6-phosphate isomerase-like protein (cupin superfamily)